MNLLSLSGLDTLPFSVFAFLFIVFSFLGLVIGSFVSAMAERLPKKESMFTRSHCQECGYKLGVFDLLPVLSWLMQKGCCRYCKRPVSRFYPQIEMISLAMSLAIFIIWWGRVDLIFLMLSLPFFLALVIIDKRQMILPNSLVVTLLAIGFLRLGYNVYMNGFNWDMNGPLLPYISGAVLFFVVAYLFSVVGAAVLKKPALGLGDVKLFGVAGLWLGLSSLPVFLISAGFLGVLTGASNAMRKKSAHFAFGPALIYALFIILLFQRLHVI